MRTIELSLNLFRESVRIQTPAKALGQCEVRKKGDCPNQNMVIAWCGLCRFARADQQELVQLLGIPEEAVKVELNGQDAVITAPYEGGSLCLTHDGSGREGECGTVSLTYIPRKHLINIEGRKSVQSWREIGK